MGRPTSKKQIGLGKALLNDKITRGGNSSSRHSNDAETAGSNTKLRSVTQERALDEFLSTAEMAHTDFTAEKMNVKIIAYDNINPYLLTTEQQNMKKEKHKEFSQSLTVPRRPPWTSQTTPTELDRNEKEAFLEWRRHLAQLQEDHDLLLTPFERNLEVWRQLWRVIERSDLIVQIVDARDPLLFRCTDLEKYVTELDKKKRNLLLVNKADLMTVAQRKAWAQYFQDNDIHFSFFSAALAKAENEKEAQAQEEEEITGSTTDAQSTHSDQASTDEEDSSIRILGVDELEALFISESPAPEQENGPISIGLVGYPNVGKSSTINALVGAKTVSVSATPGKTKHFQTIQLSEAVTLVDCPGLVFPNFASTPADLVCAGVLPIDQLREFSGPCALVAQRIPKPFLEELYGIPIRTKTAEEGGNGIPTSEELLTAYAISRGFTKAGQGNPDESRAARFILKDYVSGKLLFVQPPPATVDSKTFNAELYDLGDLPTKKKAPLTHVPSNASTFIPWQSDAPGQSTPYTASSKVDTQFFRDKGTVKAGVKGTNHLSVQSAQGVNGRVVMYPFQQRLNDDGSVRPEPSKMLSGRKARSQAAIDMGVDPAEMKSSKKHYKGMTKQKSRPIMY